MTGSSVAPADGVVEARRRAREQHLEAGEDAPDPHLGRCQILGGRLEQVLDPLLEQHPAAEALEQVVPVVLMSVDQPGNDETAADVEPGAVLRAARAALTYGLDLTPTDEDVAVVEAGS